MITSILEFRKFLKETVLPIANDTLNSPEPGGAQANAANLGTGTGPLDLINPTATEQNIYQRYIELKQSGKLRSELLPQLAQEFNIALEDIPTIITDPINLQESLYHLTYAEIQAEKTKLKNQGHYNIYQGNDNSITKFCRSLDSETSPWVERLSDTSIRVYITDDVETNDELQYLLSEFKFIKQDLNKKIHEGFGDKVSPTKLQKKVAEVNTLIAAALDSDGDPIGVVDTTGTWQAEMKYKPIVYKNGFVYIEYEEQGERKPNKERFKPSDSYDAFETLNYIAKLYRKAIKKHGITLPPTGVNTALDTLTQNTTGGLKQGDVSHIIAPHTGQRKSMPPLRFPNSDTNKTFE